MARNVEQIVRWLVVIACVVLAACSASAHGADPKPSVPARTGVPAARIGWPASFVSTRTEPNGRATVVVSDAHTGKLLRTLFVVPGDGARISGTAIARGGDVWITVNRGPRMLGHVAGGAPQPHTCASTVIDISATTGAQHVLIRGGDDELITDAQPSPSGDRVAYVHSGCATSYFDNSLQVKDLGSGRVVSIGAQLPRCHFLFQPRWTADGRHLAVGYAPASTAHFSGAPGTCSQPLASRLVVVSAQQGSPGVDGKAAPVDARCSVNAIAITRHGPAAVEQCTNGGFPEPVYIDGATRLIRYSPTLTILARSPLGQCQDGASMAGRRATDEVVISTYLYCPGGSAQPVTTVFIAPANKPRQVLALPGGYTSIDNISY